MKANKKLKYLIEEGLDAYYQEKSETVLTKKQEAEEFYFRQVDEMRGKNAGMAMFWVEEEYNLKKENFTLEYLQTKIANLPFFMQEPIRKALIKLGHKDNQ